MAKRINTDEIDEDFLLASVKKDKPVTPPSVQEAPPSPEPSKEENRRKRGKQDYETLFIKELNITARLGKTIYIRKEYHDRILKIVQVIGGNELSLFSYVDNVLTHHFENFQDDITQLYDQKNSSIF